MNGDEPYGFVVNVTSIEVVPEPASAIVLTSGLLGLAARRRRRAAA